MDERNTSCEEEIITGLSLEELKQEPLIDLLFGHRYKGATWLFIHLPRARRMMKIMPLNVSSIAMHIQKPTRP